MMIAILNTFIAGDDTVLEVLRRSESGHGGGALVVGERIRPGFSVAGCSRQWRAA